MSKGTEGLVNLLGNDKVEGGHGFFLSADSSYWANRLSFVPFCVYIVAH